jgi:hypothetical protein
VVECGGLENKNRSRFRISVWIALWRSVSQNLAQRRAERRFLDAGDAVGWRWDRRG